MPAMHINREGTEWFFVGAGMLGMEEEVDASVEVDQLDSLLSVVAIMAEQVRMLEILLEREDISKV